MVEPTPLLYCSSPGSRSRPRPAPGPCPARKPSRSSTERTRAPALSRWTGLHCPPTCGTRHTTRHEIDRSVNGMQEWKDTEEGTMQYREAMEHSSHHSTSRNNTQTQQTPLNDAMMPPPHVICFRKDKDKAGKASKAQTIKKQKKIQPCSSVAP